MICYISYNYFIHDCILPGNGHYHARKFLLHPMLLFESKHFMNSLNLDIHFYL